MKTYILKTISVAAAAVALFCAAEGAASIGGASPFEVMWDGGPVALSAGAPFSLKLTIRVPEGHYLYANETDVDFASLEGLIVTGIGFPKSEKLADPYLGKVVDVYRGDVSVTISGRVPKELVPGERDIVARIAFRGCSPTVCYRTEEREADFRVDVAAAEPAAEQRPVQHEVSPEPEWAGADREIELTRSGIRGLLEARDFGLILERGLPITLAIVFIAGILTSLTPCVWPVIPVVLLFVGVHPQKRFIRNLSLSATLTAGLVLVYAALGTAAVLLGKNLGFLYQQRWFLATVVLFFLAMSMAMFGVFDVRMPRRIHQRLHRLGGEGYRGAFLAGMGIGLVASPCAGPVLAALLGYVALQQSYAAGFALLIVYGTGMGLIIVLLGASYGELAGKMKSGPWMVWIRRALGIVLLFPAAFYMGSLFRWSQGPATGAEQGVRWVMSEEEALRMASESGKPVMLEFFAEWCPPCKSLERSFFGRQEITELSWQLVPLKVDATIETPYVRAMVEKYRVAGWPTVIFLDSKGRPWRDLRVNDYNPAAVERALREALRRSEEAPRKP